MIDIRKIPGGTRVQERLAKIIHKVPAAHILIFLALLTGILGGYSAVLFRMMLHYADYLFFDVIYAGLREYTGVWVLALIPVLGTICLLPFVLFFKENKGGYGVPKFLVAVHLKGGMIKTQNVFLKMICSAITIGSGGSAGVEGPSAQIGGAVGSSVGRFFKMSSSRVRALISCGAAAGLAAQFNAPITGILFAQEVIMMGKLEMDVFSAIVIASGVATMISRTHATGKPLFGFFEYTSSAFTDIILYALMGLLIGLLAFAFIRVFLYTKDLFKGIRLPMVVKMLLGSLIVGLMGLFQPGVMGDGYEYILRALRTPIEINFYVLGFLVVMKMIATSVTLGSGNFGGVFAPSLFIGAMFGGFFAGVVNIILPSVGIPEGSYALIGMGAFLAATTHAPLTSIFLLFEITGNYEVIVPVMISSVIGMMVCKNFSPESIDTAELARKGIRLHQGQEVSVLSSIKVEEIMNKDYETVSEHALFSEFIRMIQHGKQQYYPVMNRTEEFVGIVSLQDVREFMMDDGLEDLVLISEIMETRLITLHPEETLDRAMEKFTLKDIEVLPVVASDNPSRILGMLKRRDMLSAYNKALLMKKFN